ncbi:S9 family peptidase [Solimonas flava]|uniref:S9 family peptidase n=1 Tax=Solimonas flava TaxID=415849 RepID=UPI00040CEB92|nr:prolyl oligopeptidase family serine peptidase [Solimonas flava]
MDLVVFCCGALLWTAAMAAEERLAAQPLPVRDFARFNEYEEVKISPGGEYLAVTSRIEKRTVLALLRLSDMKVVASAGGAEYQHVSSFSWVSDDRVVYSIGENYGSLERPAGTGELLALDVDGSPSKYLFGYRGEMSTGTRIRAATAQYASAQVIDPLIDDPSYAVIAVYPWRESDTQDTGAIIYKINVKNGLTSPIISSPGRGETSFLTDKKGFVRYATGYFSNPVSVDTYVRSPEHPEWKKANSGALERHNIEPIAFSEQQDTAYLISDEKNGRSCLVAHHLSDDRREELACDPVSAVAGYTPSHDQTQPIRVFFEPDKVESIALFSDDPDSRTLTALTRSFSGQVAGIASWSRDGSKAVVYVSSDRNPGVFYLLDRKAKTADFLLAKRPWVDPEQMAERQPIGFRSTDGMMVHGYLTLPKGMKPENLPMVVISHGGPFGFRDHWAFDEEAQMFASRGYAVLQVNYRGSGGYGSAYQLAGKEQWGAGMIDDIAAGTHYVTGKGIADPRRVCAYGASFGGYASLMGAVRYPELYRCVVGYAGIYDLVQLKREAASSNTKMGRRYFDFYVGTSDEMLKAQSPTTYLDRLRANVMLAHGELDRNAEFDQYETLRDALKSRGYPFESLTYAGEGHGFYSEAHREELYTRMLDFIARSLSAPAGESASAMPDTVTR